MKRIVPTIIILVALGFSTCGLFKPSIGNVVETLQEDTPNLRVRAERREENCLAVCGAYYTFLSAPVGSDSWREIFTARHDDPNPIPRQSIRFIHPQISYVFFNNKYAVTMDAGKSWTVWDAWEADKSLRFREAHALYPSIVDVNIESDGRGKMHLYPISGKTGNRPVMQTNDYGRSWQLN